MEVLKFSFMQRAMLVALFLSITIPLIGLVVVNKRIAIIGDALSHVSLAGVIFGLIIGINPIIGALIFSILAALSIEGIRKKMPSYSDLSTAIIMSLGVGLASILSSFVEGATNFEAFLFGSIIAITDFELYMIIGVSIAIIILFFYFYKDLMYLSFDEVSAQLSGVNIDLVNSLFIIMTGVTVALSSRTVGVLIISSLMVIPVACSMQFKLSYKKTALLSVVFGIIFTELGLIISFYGGLKPGGTIVIIGIVTLIIIFIARRKFLKTSL